MSALDSALGRRGKRTLRSGSGILTPSSVWKFSRMAQIVLVVAVRVELRAWTYVFLMSVCFLVPYRISRSLLW